jgi:hypothetical protein
MRALSSGCAAIAADKSPDGNLGHTAQLDPGGGAGWGTWSDLGPAFTSDPAVFSISDGRPEVFARGPQSPLLTWQSRPHMAAESRRRHGLVTMGGAGTDVRRRHAALYPGGSFQFGGT